MQGPSLTQREKNHFHQQSVPHGRQLFTLEDVSLTLGNRKILDNLNMSIAKGETLFITGASGAGKTTLLRLLSLDLTPNNGKLRRLEVGRSRLFISRVFQDLRLIESKSIRKNLEVAYDPSVYESKNEFYDDMNELSRLLGISDRLDLKIKCANGGLKQKVAIIRALLARPDVLLADEPTASLDLENSIKIYELLNLYNSRRGMTVIWATHDRDLARRFTGRSVHLEKGRVIYSGHACFI